MKIIIEATKAELDEISNAGFFARDIEAAIKSSVELPAFTVEVRKVPKPETVLMGGRVMEVQRD